MIAGALGHSLSFQQSSVHASCGLASPAQTHATDVMHHTNYRPGNMQGQATLGDQNRARIAA